MSRTGRHSLAVIGILCVMLTSGCADGGGGGNSGGKPRSPAPVVVDWHTISNLIADHEIEATIQNNGAPGYVQITIKADDGSTFKERQYFDTGD
jgi:hypothetical protein